MAVSAARLGSLGNDSRSCRSRHSHLSDVNLAFVKLSSFSVHCFDSPEMLVVLVLRDAQTPIAGVNHCAATHSAGTRVDSQCSRRVVPIPPFPLVAQIVKNSAQTSRGDDGIVS